MRETAHAYDAFCPLTQARRCYHIVLLHCPNTSMTRTLFYISAQIGPVITTHVREFCYSFEICTCLVMKFLTNLATSRTKKKSTHIYLYWKRSGIVLVLLYSALWLVQKTRDTFSTNKKETKANHDLVAGVFPRLRQYGCFYFGSLLFLKDVGSCDYFSFCFYDAQS